jgi:hypothetical protein
LTAFCFQPEIAVFTNGHTNLLILFVPILGKMKTTVRIGVRLTAEQLGGHHRVWRGLLCGRPFGAAVDGTLEIDLRPYAVVWLTPS